MPRPGELLAGVAGAALLGVLFAPWFAAASAWEAFSIIDLILAAVAAAAILLVILAAIQRKPDLPIAGAALLALGGIIATLLVLYRLADPVADDRAWGLYGGLAAVVGVTIGAWIAMRDEGT